MNQFEKEVVQRLATIEALLIQNKESATDHEGRLRAVEKKTGTITTSAMVVWPIVVAFLNTYIKNKI